MSRPTISTWKLWTCSRTCWPTYSGTVLLISHDRDFLDRLVNGVIVPEGNGRWIEYAGGYSDMLAQRGADLTRESAKQSTAKERRERSSPIVAERAAKRRLLFKEKHALETLPNDHRHAPSRDQCVTGEARRSSNFTPATARLRKVTAALGDLQVRMAAAEEQWLELEILREDLANG